MKTWEKLFLAFAVVLTLLGIVLQLVPGVRFCARLCFVGAVLCVSWIGLCSWAKKDQRGRFCKRLFLVGFASGCVLFLVLEALIISHETQDRFPPDSVDAVIVLGAGVNGETPSLVLWSRIEAVRAYMEACPEVPVVLSGGKGSQENISEAEAMVRALQTSDITWNSRFLLEDCSTSTAENFLYSKEVLRASGLETDSALIAVVTNDFHLFRAELLAHRQGLRVTGVPAELPWWLDLNYHVREAFALAKSLVFD